MTYLVVGPNQCCGCADSSFVGLFETRAEAEQAARNHDVHSTGSAMFDLSIPDDVAAANLLKATDRRSCDECGRALRDGHYPGCPLTATREVDRD